MSQIADLGLIPIPKSARIRPGQFNIDAHTQLILASDLVDAEQAKMILPNLPIATNGTLKHDGCVVLQSEDLGLGSEGYRLDIIPQRVTIRANTTAGSLHGLQTLRQMLSGAAHNIPSCEINDQPRFPWRGMHLDVSRHFFDCHRIKQFLELMALHKFNTFHWHLTDDQGWRIEIETWPKLTSIGAWRGKGQNRYGGFYTKQECREIVAHATSLGIQIVPEIELPGHSQAAIAAYPWLGNSSEALAVRTEFDASPHIYAVGDRTLAFLEDCLLEVIDLFPGRFVHIGGDECNKDEWRASAEAQERVRREGLDCTDDLLTWFANRIGSFLASHDRRLIGWDEIRQASLCQDASIMVWHSENDAIEAVRAGHDVVMTPISHCYFDYYQGDRAREPKAFDGDLSLETVYDFDPIPKCLTKDEAAKILGSQGNLWTEYIADWDHLMYMAFPRACALAEVLWSSPEPRDFDGYLRRWNVHSKRLAALGVNYRRTS